MEEVFEVEEMIGVRGGDDWHERRGGFCHMGMGRECLRGGRSREVIPSGRRDGGGFLYLIV